MEIRKNFKNFKLVYNDYSTERAIEHSHDNYEIYYSWSGSRRFAINDTVQYISSGDIVFFDANLPHRLSETESTAHKKVVFNLSKDFFRDTHIEEELFSTCNVISLTKKEQFLVEKTVEQILTETAQSAPYSDLLCESILLTLLVHLARYIISARQSNMQPMGMHNQVAQIATFISEHYDKDLKLPYVASKFYLSISAFSKTFKRTTGYTFIEYLNMVRITKAKELLINTGLPVSIILSRVGYNNFSYFTKVFKGITGYTPVEYRKMSKSL